MLTNILIVLGVVICAVLVIASRKPDIFRVERALTIHASPDTLFGLITDFKRWSTWSPWENRDPNMQRTYGTPSAGRGAIYEWNGNNDVGQGRMEILEAGPHKISIKLDFFRPFEAHNVADFVLEARGEDTHVTWSMHGPAPLRSKVMQVFINMDQLVGKDFEIGLVNLKQQSEPSPAPTESR